MEVTLLDNEIHSLSQATGNMVFAVQRQIRELERQKGRNNEGKKLTTLLNSLLREF